MVDEVANSAHLRVPSVVRNRPLREILGASVFQNTDCENTLALPQLPFFLFFFFAFVVLGLCTFMY